MMKTAARIGRGPDHQQFGPRKPIKQAPFLRDNHRSADRGRKTEQHDDKHGDLHDTPPHRCMLSRKRRFPSFWGRIIVGSFAFRSVWRADNR